MGSKISFNSAISTKLCLRSTSIQSLAQSPRSRMALTNIFIMSTDYLDKILTAKWMARSSLVTPRMSQKTQYSEKVFNLR